MLPLIPLSIIEAFSEAEIDRQKDIVIARKYDEGDQGSQLTARLKQFISEDFPFRLNMCHTVVTAVAERLRVIGFDSPDTNLIDWSNEVWNANRLPALQEELYEAALRDGESFIIVEWDNDEMRPKWTFNERYTSTASDGNGTGCWIVYEQNDHHQKPLYAVKQWFELLTGGQYQARRTEYYPDKVVKKSSDGYTWRTLETIPWTFEGKPLGIAVKAFNNKGLRCEAWDAFPMQDALNKTVIDMLSSSDLTAFRIFYSLGFIPTSDGKAPAEDGSNLLLIEPGTVVGTTKTRRDAEFGAIQPADINGLMDEAHQIVLWCAMTTSTPVARFISTRLVASEATLKEQEGPLISRVVARQESFRGAWSDCLLLSAKLEQIYGEGFTSDVSTPITPIWADAASRGEQEKLTLLEQKQRLGVPQEQLWIEAGYDAKTIEKMKQMKQEARDEQQRIFGRGNQNNGNGAAANSGAASEADNGSASETERSEQRVGESSSGAQGGQG